MYFGYRLVGGVSIVRLLFSVRPRTLYLSLYSLTILLILSTIEPVALAIEKNSAQYSHIEMTSSVLQDGQSIPKQYTADGQDISPPLKWRGAPPNTRSFVLICDDPDAPAGTWTHWLLYAIPSAESELHAGQSKQPVHSDGARQGTNSFGKIGYGGPAPPPGKPHRYFFKLYALDMVPSLPPGVRVNILKNVMAGHILSQGQLMAKYSR